MKKPIYLDLLAAEFAGSVQANGFTPDLQQLAVTNAIASYLTEDAAERLLRGVPLAVNQDVRAKMLETLDQVRTYLDAKKRWNARASDADKRAEAVSSLVKLCDDPDAATRAQAAKGLAALDALEHLPKLIALRQQLKSRCGIRFTHPKPLLKLLRLARLLFD
jgi:O-methyltransferase involved in polyketide biosynthesis